jgi:hypothetical protein
MNEDSEKRGLACVDAAKKLTDAATSKGLQPTERFAYLAQASSLWSLALQEQLRHIDPSLHGATENTAVEMMGGMVNYYTKALNTIAFGGQDS